MSYPYTDPEICRWQAKILRTNTCWLWTAAANSEGYGQIRVRGKIVYAHRMSFELQNGKIPPNLLLRHTCDNPACVNPAHLLLGTQHDNAQDALNRERVGAQRKEGNSKLTWVKVREIRKLLSDGQHTKEAIARIYGIGAKTVYHIQVNNQWIDGPERPGFPG